MLIKEAAWNHLLEFYNRIYYNLLYHKSTSMYFYFKEL